VGVAQTGQTGAIKGTVTDPDGVTLPGITVILKSPALVLPQLTTVTNANGLYRFPMLAPGSYEITFMLEGMNTLVRQGIIVRLGATATVDVQMTLKSLEENVVVSGKAPTVDRQSTAGAANMDEEFLKMVPVQNRDFMDYFNLTPGVTGDTAHGSGEMDNAYQLDGVNMGDPATGTDYVGFGMDIMEEISVQAGGLSAEHGSVKGAVVNVVTKSGGNNFSGTASFYYNHESLQSENTKGTDLYDPDNPEKTGQKFKFEPVVTFGGPIVKDRLWFFANVSMSKSETYAPGYPHDKAPGEEDIAADEIRWFPYVKLTYHPNQQNKFVLSYNYSDNTRNHRGANRYYNVDTTRIQKTPTHVVNLHWTRFFGENVYANLKLALVKFEMQLHSKRPGTEYIDYDTDFSTGSYWRNKDDNQRDRYQVNLDATTFIDDLMGSHELKLGGEMQAANVGWLVETYQNPLNGCGYVLMAPSYFAAPGYYYGLNFNGGFDRKERMFNLSGYIQDTWTITNNLTINLGARIDYQSLIWPAQALDEGDIWNPNGDPVNRAMPESQTPMKWTNISPRVGLIYDIFSDGTTLFKASFSHYVQPNQTGWINTAHPNGWFAYKTYLNHVTGVPTGRYTPFWSPGSTVEIGYPGEDLSAPWMDEVTVGVEREMWEDWSLGARYIHKWDRNLIHSVDSTRLDMDALVNEDRLEWIGYQAVDLYDPYSGNTYTFWNDTDTSRAAAEYIMNPPGADRDYDGLEVTLNKRYSRGWSLNVSYVYQDSRGLIDTARGGESLGTSDYYHDPNYHINSDGRFALERRHQLKVTGLVKGPFGINLSGYFRHMSGRRWTRLVSSDYLGYVGILDQGNQTIYAEARGSNGYPDLNILDLRLEKAFRMKNWTFKLFADMFNVFNDNTTTEHRTNSSHPTYVYLEQTLINDPRVVRLGAKIEFN
jgi:hypothetical protein